MVQKFPGRENDFLDASEKDIENDGFRESFSDALHQMDFRTVGRQKD